MATQFSMLQIMNAALISQGQDEIVSSGDGSVEWRLLSRNWPLIVEAELEDGNYHFAKREEHLLSRVAGKFGYDDGYMIPNDALHVRNVWSLTTDGFRVSLDWVSDGNFIYVDETDGIYCETVVTEEPDLWTPNFCRGVQFKLEAVILRAFKEEGAEAMRAEQMGESHFERARTRSTQQRRAQPAYQPGPIALARFSGGYRRSGTSGTN